MSEYSVTPESFMAVGGQWIGNIRPDTPLDDVRNGVHEETTAEKIGEVEYAPVRVWPNAVASESLDAAIKPRACTAIACFPGQTNGAV